LIEVIDERQTGETLLDEALKMMKSSEKYGTGAWVDLMSGKYGSDSCDYITHLLLIISYQSFALGLFQQPSLPLAVTVSTTL
jgi:Golgi phosphoprotein 3